MQIHVEANSAILSLYAFKEKFKIILKLKVAFRFYQILKKKPKCTDRKCCGFFLSFKIVSFPFDLIIFLELNVFVAKLCCQLFESKKIL